MANAVLSERAVQDLRDIADYTLAQFGMGQALDYDVLIDRAIQMAANFPSIGMPYATQKGRLFHKYNAGRHAVFYQPDESGIFVVRVLHLMMDFDRHLES